jgi:hypothetical protein
LPTDISKPRDLKAFPQIHEHIVREIREAFSNPSVPGNLIRLAYGEFASAQRARRFAKIFAWYVRSCRHFPNPLNSFCNKHYFRNMTKFHDLPDKEGYWYLEINCYPYVNKTYEKVFLNLNYVFSGE